jgi:parallel beta-helix repeat protein
MDDGGGAIHAGDACGPTFSACQFLHNHVEGVAGFEGGGAIRTTPGNSLTLIDRHFEANTLAGTPAWGGAIYDWGGTITLTGCTFTEYASEVSAGAVTTYLSDMTQTECTYTGNSSIFAGAVWDDSSESTYVNCTFEDNFTANTGEDNSGGAYIANNGASATMTGCTFEGNTSSLGGGVFANVNSVVIMDGCYLEGNTASNAGGGLVVQIDSVATVTNCTFTDNESPFGGGGAGVAAGTHVTFINTLFAGNQSTSNPGGGLVVGAFNGADASVMLISSTLSGNQAPVGGAVRIDDNGGSATIVDSILWGETPDGISDPFGLATISYSNIHGGWPGNGNIDGDPLLVDPESEDHRLSTGSCAIDAADNSAVPDGIMTDLAGNPRFVDDPDTVDNGLGALPIVDMGAYEYQLPCPADGAVNVFDLLQLLEAWGPCPGCPDDLTGDDVVNVSDLLELLGEWGPCD